MCTGPATTTHPDRLLSETDSTVFVRGRIRRIIEDITAAESKIVRIRNRVERDRLALLHWQARLTGISHERLPEQ
jgi:hypothetical protein